MDNALKTWISLMFLMNYTDFLTTSVLLSRHGFVELNPFARYFIEFAGIWALFGVKLVIGVVISLAAAYNYKISGSLWSIRIPTIIFSLVTVWNLVMFL